MSNITTNYIDFRQEHRIYLLEGVLYELVGMLAITDHDEQEDDGFDTHSSPVTYYKLILDAEQMYDGGCYQEGELPPVFARRGDVISLPRLALYLLGNIYFNIDNPSILMEQLEAYDLKVENNDICDITIRLYPVYHGYRVVSDFHSSFHCPLTFISSSEYKTGLLFDVKGHKEFYTFKKLATRIGKIIYALQTSFERDIEIVRICEVKGEGTSDEQEIDLPKGYSQFLRLVRIAAEKERIYWENIRKDDE